MKKTLLIAAIASLLSTSAFAASLSSAGFAVVHSDVRTPDGAKVGIVTKVLSNRQIEVQVNGQTQVLNTGEFHLDEIGDESEYNVTLAN